ncbi:hypothetical protein C2E21_0857 [Chlorella sorokiniana]|uniref:Uncharacterized protein n=1 Tax=Chlorella sorokiniana TaxID=3076 RepID=A0A2P6U256_CHLSO|nr:hypothetical protein C2E21_0857 [Chlorella sorokiniana]|eukprot:PRW60397.1 hypothetical protein C2E21_0857 [Chlorella sorokiniana]
MASPERNLGSERAMPRAAKASPDTHFVREHVQQALPAALHARGLLQQTAAVAADATYAASHSREFASTLRQGLPASLHRMEASIRDASWAAADVAARRREQHGSGGGYLGGYLLGGLVPQRLAELWQGGGGSSLGGWVVGSGSKADSSGSDEGGMY